jgi:hypothetical protein
MELPTATDPADAKLANAIHPKPMGVAAAATMGDGHARSTSNCVRVQAQARKHRDSYRLLIGK